MIKGMLRTIACGVLLSASAAHAQHPEKQVNYIIPFGLSSKSDFTVGYQPSFFKDKFGQDLVAEYKPGGGGASESYQAMTAPNYRKGTIRHIVLFKFKPTIAASLKQLVAERFLALQGDAMRDGSSYIVSIEHGNQISLEGFGQGFEQGYIVTFQSEGDRNFYVGEPVVTDPAYYDPIHHAFKAYVGPLLDEQQGSLVFDFRPNVP